MCSDSFSALLYLRLFLNGVAKEDGQLPHINKRDSVGECARSEQKCLNQRTPHEVDSWQCGVRSKTTVARVGQVQSLSNTKQIKYKVSEDRPQIIHIID